MSIVTLEISAQVYDNYGTETDPNWKPKGGLQFNVKVDCDELLYLPDVDMLCQDLLDSESNSQEKFEYLSYNIAFQKPIKISTEKAMELMKKQYQKI